MDVVDVNAELYVDFDDEQLVKLDAELHSVDLVDVVDVDVQ